MTRCLQYGTTAKVFHWLIVALLLAQYPIGWLMPDIHRGMKPGAAMTFHVSFGMVILVLIVLRFAWRLAHPVAPESSLPPWQRLGSEAVHWLLYALVLATGNAAVGKTMDGLHQAMEWALLVVIGIHVASAMAHLFIYRDRIMQRMLPG